MAEMRVPEAERILRDDGRYGWLLGGRQAWSAQEVALAYELATGVAISHDTVMRWFKKMHDLWGPRAAEAYGGTIGWRAQRDYLIIFLASGMHRRQTGTGGETEA